jgi:hypothetical protein
MLYSSFVMNVEHPEKISWSRHWGEACGVSMNKIGENLFLFQFQDVDNCLRVLHGSPLVV